MATSALICQRRRRERVNITSWQLVSGGALPPPRKWTLQTSFFRDAELTRGSRKKRGQIWEIVRTELDKLWIRCGPASSFSSLKKVNASGAVCGGTSSTSTSSTSSSQVALSSLQISTLNISSPAATFKIYTCHICQTNMSRLTGILTPRIRDSSSSSCSVTEKTG